MLDELWQRRRRSVEERLSFELERTPSLNRTLFDAMEYSLLSGGKRLRPILLMAAADAIDGSGEKFLTTAAAIEMIHTYSLIHDDLPAMDDDDYRRGKLTNHKVFGEATAILAGDALLTLAFEVMLRQDGVAASTMLRVVNEFARAAGAAGMVGGQAIDLQSEGKTITLEELRRMHMGKTGALFRASVRSGAILAGATEDQLAALTSYAEQFGLAFQITDDVLDFVGDDQTLGKPTGSDARNQKSTYVTLTSIDSARSLAEQAIDSAVESLSAFGTEAEFLRELVRYLISRNN